jgi:formylmethanofuran dehydrogenase subunit C
VSALTLRFREPPTVTIDASPLRPDALSGMSEGELERLPLLVGNRRVPLGELCELQSGDAASLRLENTSQALRRLGHGMSSGSILALGDVGDQLGLALRGGTIEIRGNAGDLTACLMTGGLIRVSGDVGDFAAAALAGGRLGMQGGALLVGGRLGDRACDRMRRGLVAACGTAGDYAASRMIGGTLVALGGCGADPGYGMRRGSVVLGRIPERLLATFAENGTHDLPWLGLLDRELQALGFPASLGGPRRGRWTGCASAGGLGELLIAA